MNKIKCPVCGKDIDQGTFFCAWCGSPIQQKDPSQGCCAVENATKENHHSVTEEHQWPEEEKAVSFTIYERKEEDDALQENISDVPEKTKTEGWTTAKVVISIVMIGITVLLVVLVFDIETNTDVRMPDYEKVVDKQNRRESKIQERVRAQQEEARRQQEELRRNEEEEAARIREEMEEAQEADEELIDENALEERIKEILEGTVE